MGGKITVVSERANDALPLAGWLREAGYIVRQAVYSPEVNQTLKQRPPELVVYSSDQADGPDEDALRSVRGAVKVPLLVVGPTPDEGFVIRALRLGADSCVCQPLGASEFRARVEALMRRHWEWNNTSLDEVVVDADACAAIVGDREVQLTPTECRLLGYLAESEGRVVPREELFDQVWGLDDAPTNPNTLNLYIFNLRRKLERDPHRPRHLLTKWGIGYYLLRRGQRP